jgi:hypothetical protein
LFCGYTGWLNQPAGLLPRTPCKVKPRQAKSLSYWNYCTTTATVVVCTVLLLPLGVAVTVTL